MNNKALALIFVGIGIIVGALIGKSTFGFAETITWVGMLEGDSFSGSEFWETAGPYKLGGGGLIGGLLGYGLHKLIQTNRK